MTWYDVGSHAVAHDLASRSPVADTGSVTDVVDELERRAKVARRHLDAYEREMAAIDKLLPAARRVIKPDGKPYGPKDIEMLILGLRDRGTISRKTAVAAGTARKPPEQS